MSNLNTLRTKASRLCFRWLIISIGALLLFLVPAGHSSADSAVRGYFRGDAYATHAVTKVGSVDAVLGKSAWIVCPCQGTGGNTKVNQLASLQAPLNGAMVLKSGTLYNTVMARNSGSLAEVKNTSRVEALSLFENQKLALLGGLITADAVTAVANTTADASSIKSDSKGSGFVNLRIGLYSYAADVPPNTVVELKTLRSKVFGRVILRETNTTGDGVKAGTITVNMLHVIITADNPLKLPIGAEIIVGHAFSGFVRAPIQVIFSGNAYVEDIVTSTPVLLAQLGRVSPVYLGCEGTKGKTVTNTIAGLSVQSVLDPTKNLITIGAGTTTGTSAVTNGAATATTTSSVKNLSLLNGLITADEIKAVASSSMNGGQGTSSTAGSTFVNLKVNNVKVAADFRGEIQLSLGGAVIGKVVLKETPTLKPGNTRIVMIHVYITKENALLPVSTEVLVGVAQNGIKPY